MEPMSQNPYLPDGGITVMPRGQSHAESDGKGNTGIGITFGDNPVEVERGEPMVKLKDGGTGEDNLVVFGNMKIPNYGLEEFDKKAKGKKFKTYATDLTKTEAKQTKLIDKSVKKIDDLEIFTPFDRLEADALQANVIGANMKLKEIADKKQKLGDLQQSIHATAPEFGYEDVDKFNNDVMKGKVKAKKGKVNSDVPMAQYGFDVKSIVPQVNVPNMAKTSLLPNQSLAGRPSASVQALINKIVPQVNAPAAYNPSLPPIPLQYPNINRFPLTNTFGAPVSNYSPSTIPPTANGTNQASLLQNVGNFLSENFGPNSMLASELLPYLRPTNQMDLDPTQIAGEMYAMANNQVDPVYAQTLQPRLGSPIDISLQSALNANQADYNALIKNVGYNPAAQAALAAQKYASNSELLGKESQMNKEERARVFDENRQLLMQSDVRNAGVLDQQMVRQSQARSATKAQTQEALNSISSKYLENRKENRTLGIYENLYNYRYDNKGRAINMNPFAQFNIPTVANPQAGGSTGDLPIYDPSGKNIVGYKQKAKNGSIVKAIKNL
jgi:hypothetical protein